MESAGSPWENTQLSAGYFAIVRPAPTLARKALGSKPSMRRGFALALGRAIQIGQSTNRLAFRTHRGRSRTAVPGGQPEPWVSSIDHTEKHIAVYSGYNLGPARSAIRVYIGNPLAERELRTV